MRKEIRDIKDGLILSLPLILIIFGLIAYPVFVGFKLGFYEKTVGLPPIYVGFSNYWETLQDPSFHRAFINAFIYTLISMIGKLIIGMAMALALNESFKGRSFVRGILLIPWVIPSYIAALVWRWIYDGTSGVLNHFLLSIGIIGEQIAWLGSVETAMFSVTLVNIWKGFPFFGISLLAGLQIIDKGLYEAAEIDGSSALNKFFYITLPMLKPILITVFVLSTIWTFNDFPIIWNMTMGGPAGVTETLPILSYKNAFISMNISRGITEAMFMIPVLSILIFILARTFRNK